MPEDSRVRYPIGEAGPTRRRSQGLAALVFVQLCFGSFPVLVKIVAAPGAGGLFADGDGAQGAGFDARVIAFWRILVAAAVLAPMGFARHPGSWRLPLRDLLRLALAAFFGIVANQWLALEGVVRSHAVTSGVLMTLIPVFTYAVAVLARQEVVSKRRAIGIAVALVGAVGLLLSQAGLAPSAAASAPLTGGLLIVLNCLSYAIYLVLARQLLLRIAPLVVTAWTFLFALLSLPLLARGADLWPADLAPHALWAGLLLLLFPTLLGYTVSAWALARVSASTAAVFVYLQPLIGGACAMWVLGERPGLATFVAALVVFAGIWLVVRRPARAPDRLEPS